MAHPSAEYNLALSSARNSGKKTFKAEVPVDLFFCVQDVWNQNERRTAYPIRLPELFKIRLKLKSNFRGDFWTTEGYGNDIARQLGNWLASCNMPILIFSQTTRHLMTEIKNHRDIREFVQEPSKKVKAYLSFAKAELGFTSELFAGLSNGIGIHTQAIIEEEQLAVEEFFKTCKQGVICATGTLAQGLNLPASAVVVNTTKQHVSDTEAPKPHFFVFFNQYGRAFYPESPYLWFRGFLKKHNLKYIKFHDLRHTSATLLINQGVHAKIISERLGHANITTTMNIYGHVLSKADKETKNKFDQIILVKNRKEA